MERPFGLSVQWLNIIQPRDTAINSEELTTLRILEQFGAESVPSQRELSRRLNISLGMVNLFLKRLLRKGYFKVTTIPVSRAKYLLTPKGFAEKSRLTLRYLEYSLRFYKELRQVIERRVRHLEQAGVRRVAFSGSGEIAELAGLFVQQSNMELVGVADDQAVGTKVLNHEVIGHDRLSDLTFDRIIITSFSQAERQLEVLLALGYSRSGIVRFGAADD
jgi:DNA-binding MarR family transcriptional regulator